MKAGVAPALWRPVQSAGNSRGFCEVRPAATELLLIGPIYASLTTVNRLTRREQMVLIIVVGLLLVGWAVKSYRVAHPPRYAVEPAKF